MSVARFCGIRPPLAPLTNGRVGPGHFADLFFADPEMDQGLERIYREHAAVLTARLTRTFGVAHIDLVESVVHDAFVRALEVWGTGVVPEAPLAWLTTVARNQARDRLRRGARFSELAPGAQRWLELERDPPESVEAGFEREISDDLLRMMFVACHPELPIESRVVLALRTLCSLSTVDIARALLVNTDAVEKRLTRARARLRDLSIAFELPLGEDEVLARLDSVLAVLYLLFSEGYHAHSGERPIKVELCRDAIRLARILAEHPVAAAPRTAAVAALFCLQAARLDARFDDTGDLVPLAEQDRSCWDRQLIAEGLAWLDRAACGDALSAYHLQAGIAACHDLAPSFAATRWDEIVGLYDQLRIVDDSPVVALNRAIAVGWRDGPHEGLTLLDALDHEPRFHGYALLHAARADMLARAGDRARAADSYTRAAELAGTPAERRFLQRRRTTLAAAGTDPAP